MIVLRNDTDTEVFFELNEVGVAIEPKKSVEINLKDFMNLYIPNHIVKIRNGVIKIKG